MKKLKVLIGAVALLAAASISFSASVDTSGIGLSGPNNLDAPPFVSRTWLQANNWPAVLTNGGQIIFTNVIIAVERDQGVGISGTFSAQGAPAFTNNNVLYGDMSYDGGRTFTTTRPISFAVTPTTTNAVYRPALFIPYTNFSGAQVFRLTALSNTIPAGATAHAFMRVTNLTLTTRKANPR